MSAITTHVLDTSLGRPASDVRVTLDRQRADGGWEQIGQGTTDADGRLQTLMPPEVALEHAVYRLVFDTKSYFVTQGITTLYPHVVIVFETTTGNTHYHVPLLVSPYGYSTYRGS